MNYRYWAFILLLFSVSVTAQNKKQTILRIDDQYFSKDEFLNIYQKNNTNLVDTSDVKTPSEYMELFINYKLKVIDAEKLGLDTLASFRKELKGYRDELAQPYLTDAQFNEEMVKTAYYRTKYERKASHILIEVDPKDTLKAWTRINELRKEIMAGADFNDMAFQYSNDPSAKQNRGELGYFSGGMMVFPFEDAAYKTPVGEISEPIRTKFGYHLIKVEDERESKGQMVVAHLMKRRPLVNMDGKALNDQPPRSVKSLKNEIDSIYVLLKNGANFEEMVRKYSDDKYSVPSGGRLQPFTEGRMIPAFAEAAFALKNDGDISSVVETPYGWHIIKRLKYIPVPAFDEVKDRLIENIRKNPQMSQRSRDAFVAELKKNYHYSTNMEAQKQLEEKAVINFHSNKITAGAGIDTTSVLFSFDGYSISVADYIRIQNEKGGVASREEIAETIEKIAGDKLVEMEDSHLEEKYPDFRQTMQEYHDGILLFNISEKLIWNKASEDTLGLKAFYEKNKYKYMGAERFKGWVINCKDLNTRSLVDEALAMNGMTKDELLTIVNSNADAVNIVEGTFRKGDNPVVDYYIWNAEKPVGMDEFLTYVRGDKLPPEPQTLEESKGMHIADYQNILEQKWVAELRKEHHIAINKKLLKSIPSLK